MATVRYRRLDDSYEPVYGSGKGDFVEDIYAVAQSVLTRLNLWLEEWWEDVNDGLPMTQQILGVAGAGVDGMASSAIQDRVLGTPFVTGITNVNSAFNGSNRSFTFSCVATVSFSDGTLHIVGTYNTTRAGTWDVSVKGV